VKDADNSEKARSQKGSGKGGNAKPSNNVSATQVKGKDGRDAVARTAVSNGSVAVNSQLKQPLKSNSFNERQGQASKVWSTMLFAFGPCVGHYLHIC
jgi:hypothetical protein